MKTQHDEILFSRQHLFETVGALQNKREGNYKKKIVSIFRQDN